MNIVHYLYKRFSYFQLVFIIGLLLFNSLQARTNKDHLPLLGEQLHFKIVWNGLLVGYSSLAIPRTIRYKGSECYIIQSGAGATGAVSHLYPISHIHTSYWDPRKKRTLFYEKYVVDQEYLTQYRVHMDYKNKKAHWQQKKIKQHAEQESIQETKATVTLQQQQLNDNLSLFYTERLFFQKKQIALNQIFEFSVFDKGKEINLRLKVTEFDDLMININDQKRSINAFALEPENKNKGLFLNQEQTKFWISKDENYWPLIIELRSQAGVIQVLLTNVITIEQ